MKFKSNSYEDTIKIGQKFAKKLKPHDIIAMYGSMGMGKTAFVCGLAKGLNCIEQVSSPTFAIVNEYPGEIPLFHFDLYRLNGEDDLYDIGFYDYLDREGICAIEWSERLGDELPKDTIKVFIQQGENENDRLITIEGVEF